MTSLHPGAFLCFKDCDGPCNPNSSTICDSPVTFIDNGFDLANFVPVRVFKACGGDSAEDRLHPWQKVHPASVAGTTETESESRLSRPGLLSYIPFISYGKKKPHRKTAVADNDIDSDLCSATPDTFEMYLTTVAVPGAVSKFTFSAFLGALMADANLPGLLSLDGHREFIGQSHCSDDDIARLYPFKVELSGELCSIRGLVLRSVCPRQHVPDAASFSQFMTKFGAQCDLYRHDKSPSFCSQLSAMNSAGNSRAPEADRAPEVQSSLTFRLPLPALKISAEVPILTLSVFVTPEVDYPNNNSETPIDIVTVPESEVVPVEEFDATLDGAIDQLAHGQKSELGLLGISRNHFRKLINELTEDLANSVTAAFEVGIFDDQF